LLLRNKYLMSLSRGLKNAVLLACIILIGHFLVRTAIAEYVTAKPSNKTERFETESTAAPSVPSPAPIAQPHASVAFVKAAPACGVSAPAVISPLVDDEMYEYAFGPSTVPATPAPLPPSCGAARAPSPPQPPIPQCASEVRQQANGTAMVVAEYQSENAMNGGAMLGGLQGYDSLDQTFVELSSA
jgi:hypothetical protein